MYKAELVKDGTSPFTFTHDSLSLCAAEGLHALLYQDCVNLSLVINSRVTYSEFKIV